MTACSEYLHQIACTTAVLTRVTRTMPVLANLQPVVGASVGLLLVPRMFKRGSQVDTAYQNVCTFDQVSNRVVVGVYVLSNQHCVNTSGHNGVSQQQSTWGAQTCSTQV